MQIVEGRQSMSFSRASGKRLREDDTSDTAPVPSVTGDASAREIALVALLRSADPSPQLHMHVVSPVGVNNSIRTECGDSRLIVN